ncbi:response regulator transcription factor [Paramaledivibacter caminithermalis]|jgi:DNA-binding response OmpR family regulator|uniref:Stage 0 sporulation protein A homolog n=1 Tax=Paramaledivibacter caminithermalis (strain DSM 15212 / CIP 107654 / DViRD3) TaxID=1121301 RepID=A0A1M6TJ39_PARC5|nr:response regulator transcription factor [Paramaledivibacter caminithermalis]SHK57102.1 DNA-binding response regulator, OmpR family, contains REC and winged-helix (wHTH) domain [Paramaledivibacter caminithermalis DSM 15212]
MSKILIIDDEEDLVTLLKDSLESRGHIVLAAYDGEKGIKKSKEQPDIIILDVMMPGIDGYEVCRRIRDAVLCPIIFLSAKQSENDKLKGLALGGDDYLIKPFSLNELLARIDAHLRREKRAIFLNNSNKRVLISFCRLSVDLKSRQVKIDDNIISFTKREFDILELLLMHPGQVFSKEQIYEKVWGYDAEGDFSTVTEHMKNIRAKIAEFDCDTEYISTVWGIGYRFNKIM